jgi:MFS family permease
VRLTTRQRALFGAFVFMLATISAFAVPIYADGVQKAIHGTASQVGLLTTAFAAVYAATQVPAGFLGGRAKPNRAFAIALAALAVSLVASAFVSSLAGLLALRALTGLAAGTLFPMAAALVRATDERENSRAQSIVGTGWGVGYLFSAAALPLIFSSWRSPLQVLAAIAVAGSLIALVGLPSSAPELTTAGPGAAKAALTDSGIWLLGLFLSGLTFANVGIAAWAVPFATHQFDLSMRQGGLLASLIAVGILPAPLAGAAFHHRAGTGAVLGLSVAGMAGAVGTLAAPVPLPIAAAGLILTGWSAALPFGVALALIDKVAESGQEHGYGLLAGAVNGIGFLSGMASPPLIGLIHDHGATFPHSFLVLLAGPAVALAASAAIMRRVRRSADSLATPIIGGTT